MRPGDEEAAAPLVAIALPPTQAVPRILDAWEEGVAVLPLDPAAPPAARAAVLDRLRPTHLIDGDGLREREDGHPVAAGVAAVVRTSGTTGEPRGVELTFDGLRASARGVAKALRARLDARWLCCLPVHHVAGLAIVARSWHGGVEPTVLDRFEPADVSAAVSAGSTLVSLVPTTLARLLDAAVGLDGLEHALVGAAPLPPALRRRALDAGVPVTTTYGLTETWGGVLHDGHPLEGAEVTLHRDGEILVRGPMVMRGYRFEAPHARPRLDETGTLFTGDLGSRAADGSVACVDRIRDLIVSGGVNISPAEVEAALATHPGVADVAVGAVPDEHWGELVVAYVVPRDPAQPVELDELRSHVKARLGSAAAPRRVVTVPSLPRSGSGKLLRRALPSHHFAH